MTIIDENVSKSDVREELAFWFIDTTIEIKFKDPGAFFFVVHLLFC